MSEIIRSAPGYLSLSTELLADVSLGFALREMELLADVSFGSALREMELDDTFGRDSRHHPDRRDLHAIKRPERVRRNIRRNLQSAGLAGAVFAPFVTARTHPTTNPEETAR